MSETAVRVYSRQARLPFRTLEGETVILHPRRSGVHVLNGTGSLIWELLDRRRSAEEVVSELRRAAGFDADADKMLQDVVEFLQELEGKELVVAEDSPP